MQCEIVFQGATGARQDELGLEAWVVHFIAASPTRTIEFSFCLGSRSEVELCVEDAATVTDTWDADNFSIAWARQSRGFVVVRSEVPA